MPSLPLLPFARNSRIRRYRGGRLEAVGQAVKKSFTKTHDHRPEKNIFIDVSWGEKRLKHTTLKGIQTCKTSKKKKWCWAASVSPKIDPRPPFSPAQQSLVVGHWPNETKASDDDRLPTPPSTPLIKCGHP